MTVNTLIFFLPYLFFFFSAVLYIYVFRAIILQLIHFIELLSAYGLRHLPTLERALGRAKSHNYDKILDPEILLAERLQKRLETLKSLKKEVMMTDVQAITELKRYNQPPDGVYQIMACTLLLLGHPPWEIDVSLYSFINND